MQRNFGPQGWLKVPRFYNVFQDAIGGNALRQRFIRNHVRAKPGDKVIDIGCGPAQILPWLPEVDYLGLDTNPACIASAKQMHPDRGTFVVGNTESLWDDSRFRDADVVIGLGILHHLGDKEAEHCVRFAHRTLKQGGRFVCFEACWVPDQGFLSRYIMSRDRGQHIRTEQSYCDLVQTAFKDPMVWVQPKALRIPSATLVLA